MFSAARLVVPRHAIQWNSALRQIGAGAVHRDQAYLCCRTGGALGALDHEGVEPYDSTIQVDFFPAGEDRVRMVITSSRMRDAQTTQMQGQGMAGQVSKLDQRYRWQG
jgi:hypothetical protein